MLRETHCVTIKTAIHISGWIDPFYFKYFSVTLNFKCFYVLNCSCLIHTHSRTYIHKCTYFTLMISCLFKPLCIQMLDFFALLVREMFFSSQFYFINYLKLGFVYFPAANHVYNTPPLCLFFFSYFDFSLYCF